MTPRAFRRSFLPLVACLWLAILAVPTTGAAQTAAGNWTFFSINAQYRGGVKKGFSDLGCGLLFDTALADGQHQVIFHACVSHPEKKNHFYSLRLNLSFRRAQDGLTTTAEPYAWFNEDFPADQQAQVKDMVLLLPLIMSGQLVSQGKTGVKINQSLFRIDCRILGGGKRAELDIFREAKDPVEGKFFLEAAGGGRWSLDKFRLKKGKISTSFVQAPQEQIQKDYAGREPFQKVVFGR